MENTALDKDKEKITSYGANMNIDKLSGLELLEKVVRGEIPHPSMTATIPMKLMKAERGFAEFEAKADKNHLNPMGAVHGGFAATVLDSVTGCAVHSMLGPGDRYGTIDLNVKMLKPLPINVIVKARGRVIHCSKRLGVSEGILEDVEGKIYAHATAICMISRIDNGKRLHIAEPRI